MPIGCNPIFGPIYDVDEKSAFVLTPFSDSTVRDLRGMILEDIIMCPSPDPAKYYVEHF
jgi:hypothetical protein